MSPLMILKHNTKTHYELTRFECLQPKANLLCHTDPQLVSQEEGIDAVQDGRETDSLAP